MEDPPDPQRRLDEAIRRHRQAMDAARGHLMETIRRGQTEIEEATRALRDALDSHRRGNRPGRKRRSGEPDAGGVPVEPNRPRNLSGGAAAVPEIEA